MQRQYNKNLVLFCGRWVRGDLERVVLAHADGALRENHAGAVEVLGADF